MNDNARTHLTPEQKSKMTLAARNLKLIAELKERNLQKKQVKQIEPENKNDNFVKNKDNEQSTNSEDAGVQPKGIISSSRNDEVANVLRGKGQDDPGTLRGSRTGKSEQENQLKQYAEENGIWLNNDQIKELTSEQLPSGKEADIYFDKSGTKVIKVVNYQRYSNSPLDFFNNRILAFNELFNGTKYSIIGFTETGKGFSFVLSQPLIKGKLLSRLANSPESLDKQQQRVSEYMREKFGMESAGLDAFENDSYKIEDVHLKNVIEGIDGNLYFIDVIPTDKKTE